MLTEPVSLPPESSTPARPSVPKWPFILGDVALVLVALAMSSTASALSETQMLFCLGAVGLGGVLLVTPFVLEAFPPAAWRMFSGSSHASSSSPDGLTEGELRRQARAAAEAVEHAARANAALESSARRFDARFAPLVEVQKNLEALVTEMREAAASRQSASAAEAQAIQREFDRLRKEHAEKFKTAETKIAALEETLGVIASHLKTLAASPAPASPAPAPVARKSPKAAAPAAIEAPTAVAVEEPALVAAGVAVAEAPSLGSISVEAADESISPPESIAEATPAEEPTMLAKALATAQPAAETPAVADIIQSRPRRARKSKPHLPLDSLSAPVEIAPAVEAAAEPVAAISTEPATEEKPAVTEVAPDTQTHEATSPEEPESENPTIEVVSRVRGETASALRRSARAKAIALRGEDEEESGTPAIFTPPTTEESADSASGPSQGELLAREADTIRRKRATKSPHAFATLTARVLIGIGNKPFIRGEGPGLSTEKGVPMEFVEIGQWRWVAPKDAAGPITLRILKNDEIPAAGDPITLKPGQALEVSPVFPS